MLLLLCLAVVLTTAFEATPSPTSEVLCNFMTPRPCAAGMSCCGNYTMEPSCYYPSIAQCCTWYDSAALCAPNATCCGAGGPGTSSGTFCCKQGDMCCASTAQGESQCCASRTHKCCGGDYNYCCKKDETCCRTGPSYEAGSCCAANQTCCGNICCDSATQRCIAGQCQWRPTMEPSPAPGPIPPWALLYQTCSGKGSKAFITPGDSDFICVHNINVTRIHGANNSVMWSRTVQRARQTPIFIPDPNLVYIDGLVYDARTGAFAWGMDPTMHACFDNLIPSHVRETTAEKLLVVMCLSHDSVWDVVALSATTGKQVWKYRGPAGFSDGSFRTTQGVMAYIVERHNQQTLVALNISTGALLYTSHLKPNLIPMMSFRHMAVLPFFCGGDNVCGLDPVTGKESWSLPIATAPTVSFHLLGAGGYVGFAAVYNGSIHLIAQDTGKVMWQSRGGFHTSAQRTTLLIVVNTGTLLVEHEPKMVTAVRLSASPEVLWTVNASHVVQSTADAPYFFTAGIGAKHLDVFNATTGAMLHQIRLLPEQDVGYVAVPPSQRRMLVHSHIVGVQAYELPDSP